MLEKVDIDIVEESISLTVISTQAKLTFATRFRRTLSAFSYSHDWRISIVQA